jgi:hypothetical protein
MGLRDRYLAAMQSRCAIASPGQRNTQRALVHVAPPIAGQHATSAQGYATSHATTAQHGADLHSYSRATGNATSPQQVSSVDATDVQRKVQTEIRIDGTDSPAVAWNDADISAFLDRRARLLRWGWAEPEAETLAERLGKRDREQDDRVSCTDCTHYRPGRCGNHRAAGLNSPELGRDLATMLQRCPGFESAR